MRILKQLKSQSGLSVIEVVVSFLVLGILVVSMVSLQRMRGAPYTRELSLCRNHLNSIMDTLRSRGQAARIFNFEPAGSAARNMPVPASGSNDTQGVNLTFSIATALRWPQTAAFFITPTVTPTTNPFVWETGNVSGLQSTSTLSSSTSTIATTTQVPLPENVAIRNAMLVDSYMNSLLAVYNSDPTGFCSTATGKAIIENNAASDARIVIGQPDQNPGKAGTNYEVFLRIEPRLNTDSNTAPSTACPSNLVIAPQGIYTATSFDTPADQSLVNFAKVGVSSGTTNASSNVFNDLGLLVTLTGRFTTRKDNSDGSEETFSCEVADFFRFESDLGVPAMPVVGIVNNTSYAGNVIESCASTGMNTTADFTVQITTVASEEQGVVYMCQDQSVYIVGTEGAEVRSAGVAVNYPNLDLFGARKGLPILLPPNDGSVYRYTKYRVMPPRWVPCDQTTVCGVSPTSVSVSPSGTAGDRILSMTYRAQRGCMIDLRVVAVDTAGNLSTIATLGGTEPPTGSLPSAEGDSPFGVNRFRTNYPKGSWVPETVGAGATCAWESLFGGRIPDMSCINVDVPYPPAGFPPCTLANNNESRTTWLCPVNLERELLAWSCVCTGGAGTTPGFYTCP